MDEVQKYSNPEIPSVKCYRQNPSVGTVELKRRFNNIT
jgi:hypothetical protein